MQLYILDKNPIKCAEALPTKYRFKMLLELAQMCSTITGCGTFKPIRQGKEIQGWIRNHPRWVGAYSQALYNWCLDNINMMPETKRKLEHIFSYFMAQFYTISRETKEMPHRAPFRYSEKYTGSEYPSKCVLKIDICIEEYKKYLAWKLQEVNK